MKYRDTLECRLMQFRERYTLGTKFDDSIGFMDTVNLNKIFKEDFGRALLIMYEAIEQEKQIHDDIIKIINKNIEYANKINVYFVTDWLRSVLTLGKPLHDVFMQCSTLVGKLFPDIAPCIGFDVHNVHHNHTVYEHMLYVVDNCETSKFEVKLGALFHDVGKPNVITKVNGRYSTFGHPRESAELARSAFDFYIKLSREEIDYITELILIHDEFISPTDRSIRRLLNKYSIGFIDDYCTLKKSDMADHINITGVWKKYDIDEFRDRVHILHAKNQEFGLKDLNIRGTDIINKLNIEANKIVGIILKELLSDVLAGRVKNNRDDLMERVSSIYEKYMQLDRLGV